MGGAAVRPAVASAARARRPRRRRPEPLMAAPLSVAIVGAGIGGLAAAAALRLAGIDVQVYEQAQRFARVGAGIQQSPNAMKVLRRLGLEGHLLDLSFKPDCTFHKAASTGELLWQRMMGRHVQDRYGAPYLYLHRGDLHAALASIAPAATIHLDKQLVGLEQTAAGAVLSFADNSRARADAVIGADGVHSTVRDILLGTEKPRFTGRVAYRTTFPAALLRGAEIDDCTKWWGSDRHIVVYYVNP